MAVCIVGRLRESLSPDDQEDLDDLLDDPTYSSRVLARALRAEGHQVSHSSIQSHRKEDCQCRSATQQTTSEPLTGLKAAALAQRSRTAC